MKYFIVNINMNCSKEYKVSAKSKTEAKKKALKKFNTKLPKKLLSVDTYQVA